MTESISRTVIVQDIISGIVVSIIVAVFVYVFLHRYLNKLNFSKKMESYGISLLSTKSQTPRDIDDMFNKAKEIKIMFVSGTRYLKCHKKRLIKFAEKPKHSVKILIAAEKSPLLKDIECLENKIGERKKKKKITKEIEKVSSFF